MSAFTIRVPEKPDAAAINAIDMQGLATGHATFREVPHDWDSFTSSFLTRRGMALVAEDPNGIVGWAGISPVSQRAVYRGVGEVSIYVLSERQRRGVGRFLLDALVGASEREGYWTLVAQIFPENKASLSLHAASGFKTIGTRTKLGLMSYGPFEDRWRDVVMLERRSRVVGGPS